MGLKRNHELVLFGIEEIKFNDKTTGDPVTKYKYSFFDKNDELVIGYLDTKEYEDKVQDVGNFEDGTPSRFKFSGREYDGELKWRLDPPEVDTSNSAQNDT